MYSKAQQCDHSNYSSLRRHLVANHGIGSIQIIHFTYAIISNNKHTKNLSIVFATSNKFKSQVVSTECFKPYFFGDVKHAWHRVWPAALGSPNFKNGGTSKNAAPWHKYMSREQPKKMQNHAEPHIKTFKTSQNAFECWMSVDLHHSSPDSWQRFFGPHKVSSNKLEHLFRLE